MPTLWHFLGMTMIGLVGVVIVLGLIAVVLYQVRFIIRFARHISQAEPPPREYSPDPPSQHVLDDYWRN